MTEDNRIQNLSDTYRGKSGPIPQSVLSQVFDEWVKGETDDAELVAHLLPLDDQPMLLRLQILAQSANLGKTLLSEVEKRLRDEMVSVEALLSQLDEAEPSEDTGDPRLIDSALVLYASALNTLLMNLNEGAPQAILESLRLGREASAQFDRAFRQAS